MCEVRILLFFAIAFDLHLITVIGQSFPLPPSAKYSNEIKAGPVLESIPNTPWKDVSMRIFDKQEVIPERYSEDKDIDVDDLLLDGVSTAVGAIPDVGPILQLFITVLSKLENEPAWKNKFKETIIEETERKAVLDEISRLSALIDAILKSLTSANDDASKKFPRIAAWDTRKDLDYMINIFFAQKSIFKKYPLIGAPLLIELGKLISVFDKKIDNDDISCKMRDVLREYRLRSVAARLDKISIEFAALTSSKVINSQYLLPFVKNHVWGLEYNSDGYSETDKWSCKSPKKAKEVDDKQVYDSFKKRHDDDFDKNFEKIIFHDEFGKREFFPRRFSDQTPSVNCFIEYFGWVRHRVEEQFLVEEKFSKFCVKETQKPTGM